MAHQVTITAKTGPDRTNTALVLADVDKVLIDPVRKIIQVSQIGKGGNIKEHDLVAATTVTCTITAGQYAFVVS